MVGSFGPRLRAERERKNLSLQAIAEETKIKVSLLEGLEQDDLSFWPTGLFRRAYVRSYARAIGLDPERTLREFLDQFPEPVEPESDDPILSPRDLLSSPIATVSSLLRRGSRSAPAPRTRPHPSGGCQSESDHRRRRPGTARHRGNHPGTEPPGYVRSVHQARAAFRQARPAAPPRRCRTAA